MSTALPTDPDTLQEAIEYFSDPDRCHEYVIRQRWPNGVTCPICGSSHVGYIRTRRVFECRETHAKRQFTAKKGTIFEDSPIPLKSWLLAMWLVVNCKNGVSSYEISRAIEVTQKATWHMMHRIRAAMQAKDGGKLGGEVEVDETYIGGKARFMHADRKARTIRASSKTAGKVAVMGLLERNAKGKSRVRTAIVPNAKRHHLRPVIDQHVETGSTLHTDALRSYNGLNADYIHNVIDHAECYAKGEVHTNGMENFWSLLKRSIKGTYVSVEPFHLFRYLDEQAFRFNEREMTDGERFRATLRNVTGKRVTYAQLTGKELPA